MSTPLESTNYHWRSAYTLLVPSSFDQEVFRGHLDKFREVFLERWNSSAGLMPSETHGGTAEDFFVQFPRGSGPFALLKKPVNLALKQAEIENLFPAGFSSEDTLSSGSFVATVKFSPGKHVARWHTDVREAGDGAPLALADFFLFYSPPWTQRCLQVWTRLSEELVSSKPFEVVTSSWGESFEDVPEGVGVASLPSGFFHLIPRAAVHRRDPDPRPLDLGWRYLLRGGFGRQS